MKLTIERLITLTNQDYIDLAKIWPRQVNAQWDNWLDQGNLLFAARFNQRLLAAVKVQLTGEHAELRDLMVREITRRRGVGLYLLEDLQRQLPQVAQWRLADNQPDEQDDDTLTPFMLACGFHRRDGHWQK